VNEEVLGHWELWCHQKPVLALNIYIDDPTCPSQMGPQSTEHLIRECTIINKQRDTLQNGITNAGGGWLLSNSELANKYTNLFQKFVNSINFEGL
jgi:hypothetical protein